MRDDIERVLGEMENIGCHWPQVSKLIALARAAAIGHGGGHNNMRCPICAALRALTETNQPTGSE